MEFTIAVEKQLRWGVWWAPNPDPGIQETVHRLASPAASPQDFSNMLSILPAYSITVFAQIMAVRFS